MAVEAAVGRVARLARVDHLELLALREQHERGELAMSLERVPHRLQRRGVGDAERRETLTERVDLHLANLRACVEHALVLRVLARAGEPPA